MLNLYKNSGQLVTKLVYRPAQKGRFGIGGKKDGWDVEVKSSRVTQKILKDIESGELTADKVGGKDKWNSLCESIIIFSLISWCGELICRF